jgi:hypothetical protein
MPIRTADVVDQDFFDAYELASDGYKVYLTTTLVSTTFGTKTVVINLPSDGIGILYSQDHLAEPGDLVRLVGTSGTAADGYFTIDTIVDDVTFTVVETIASSTGGTIYFMFPSGASRIGFDPTGLTITTSHTVQGAIKEIAQKALTAEQHETLRQLIHFIDEGPADGFASGAFKEIIGQPFPSSIIWYVDNTKTQKIVEKLITRNSSKNPTSIVWNMYDFDGVTIVHTVTDSITYTLGAFESTRTRTIS